MAKYKRGAEVMTTAEVAEACHFSQHKVIKLIDKGLLPGWKVPYSRHRRVLRSKLVQWMRQQGLPSEWADEVNKLCREEGSI